MKALGLVVSALGLVVSEKKIFYVFPMTSPGRAHMNPRGTVSRIYKEYHYTLLHTKYESSGPCDFGGEDFLCFSHEAPRAGSIWTPGARLAGFIKRTTIHCYTQNMKALGHVVSEKKIFYVFPMTPPGRDPRGTVGRIYKEDHYTLLHTKYESSGPCGFDDAPRAGPVLTPGAWLAGFI